MVATAKHHTYSKYVAVCNVLLHTWIDKCDAWPFSYICDCISQSVWDGEISLYLQMCTRILAPPPRKCMYTASKGHGEDYLLIS